MSPIRRHSSTINSKCLNSSLNCPETSQTYSKCFELIADRYIFAIVTLITFLRRHLLAPTSLKLSRIQRNSSRSQPKRNEICPNHT